MNTDERRWDFICVYLRSSAVEKNQIVIKSQVESW